MQTWSLLSFLVMCSDFPSWLSKRALRLERNRDARASHWLLVSLNACKYWKLIQDYRADSGEYEVWFYCFMLDHMPPTQCGLLAWKWRCRVTCGHEAAASQKWGHHELSLLAYRDNLYPHRSFCMAVLFSIPALSPSCLHLMNALQNLKIYHMSFLQTRFDNRWIHPQVVAGFLCPSYSRILTVSQNDGVILHRQSLIVMVLCETWKSRFFRESEEPASRTGCTMTLAIACRTSRYAWDNRDFYLETAVSKVWMYFLGRLSNDKIQKFWDSNQICTSTLLCYSTRALLSSNSVDCCQGYINMNSFQCLACFRYYPGSERGFFEST